MTSLSVESDAAASPQAPREAAVVRADRVSRIIDNRPILRQISFEVHPGSLVGLLGANGAGKSTLLSLLATLTTTTDGQVELFGEAVTRQCAHLRARIGMIGHQPMLYRDLTAIENLVFFGKLYGIADPRARAMTMLEQVDLADRAGDAVGTFSRGMTQRVAIARALMHDPDLLLADEPFSGLDIASTHTLIELLARLHEEGRTIILAHHDLHQAFDLTQRLLVLRKGMLVLDAAIDTVTLEQVRAEVIAR